MVLKQIVGTDSIVVDDIGSSEKLDGIEGVNSVSRKVLSVTWDPERDDFVFCFESVMKLASNILPYTKRNILKMQASFFNPLGHLSPITLQCKFLFKGALSGLRQFLKVL